MSMLLLGLIQQEYGDGRNFWFPAQASNFAHEYDWVFYFVLWLSTFFFVAIVATMTLFVIKYRRRDEGEAAPHGPSHNSVLEVTWTVIPMILVGFLFWFGFKGYMSMRVPPRDSYNIRVKAAQWSWTFQYPGGAESDVLYVPKDKDIKLTMSSSDVIHALYIPAFRVKYDIVPGRYTRVWFRPTMKGEFHLFCAEYCGRDHSRMTTQVVVMDKFAFDARLQELEAESSGDPVEYGKKLYVAKGCSGCHTLDGSKSQGPSWKGLFGKERVFSNAPKQVADEGYLRESMITPHKKLVKGFGALMPVVPLKDRQIDALIEYIKTVK